MTVRKLTEDDAKAIRAIQTGAKGDALLKRRSWFAFQRAAELSVSDLGDMALDTLAERIDEAAAVEGVEIEPIAVADEVAGIEFKTTDGKPIRDPFNAAVVAIYGHWFADDEPATRKAPKPKVRVEHTFVVAPIVIRLQYPIVVEGERIDEIELRPPLYGHTLAVRSRAMTRHDMVAAMAGLHPEAIDALRYSDAERVISAAFDMAPNLAGA